MGSHWRSVLGVVPSIDAASPIFTNRCSIRTCYDTLRENLTIGWSFFCPLECRKKSAPAAIWVNYEDWVSVHCFIDST